MPSRRQNLVPQARQSLDQLKYEVAQSIGVTLPQDGYYGFLQTRDAGAIGGNMVRTMITMAEQQLAGQFGGATGATGAAGAGASQSR
ncbi:MAG: alpha/beta-type small acid-soluble spore protein [Cohnella sp.]|nr:alpha/beta-type small acid-soluble spore protein [Cohnella sp.]